MNWMQFLASVIGSLAWPLVAFAFLVVFRKNIAGLFDRVEEWTFWGNKTIFAKQVKQGREEAEALVQSTPATAVTGSTEEKLAGLIFKPPNESVLEAFEQVEAALLPFREKLSLPPQTNLGGIMSHLRRNSLVDGHTASLFTSLYNARNTVKHFDGKGQVGLQDAIEYWQQASVLASRLRAVYANLKKPPQ